MERGGDAGGRPGDVVDATRRTRLASERTYLAWWRSGLTAVAVALGAGKLVPELSGGDQWPYVVLGSGFAVLALAFIGYGWLRQREMERALDEGRYAPLDARASLVLTAAGLLLGLGTLAALLLDQ